MRTQTLTSKELDATGIQAQPFACDPVGFKRFQPQLHFWERSLKSFIERHFLHSALQSRGTALETQLT
jgi:hypothetical protein